MKKTRLTRTVSFRVTDDQYAALTALAAAAGAPVADWCRDTVLTTTENTGGLTPNEWIIFEEIARLRYLVGLGFGLVADNKLTRDEWEKVRNNADEKSETIARKILAQRKQPSR